MKSQIPKITKPALAGISARVRLFRRLDEASRRHAVVWVSAPAGSGKTTLAAIGREQGHDSLSLMSKFLPEHFGVGWRKDVSTKLAALALEHGIEAQHVVEMIRASRLEAPDRAPDSWPWPVRIRMLGEFEVWRSGERVSFGGRMRRPLELLRTIVALGGTGVKEQALIDLLWPEAEGDAAAHALVMTIHRLRKLIGLAGAVVHRDRRVSLDLRICWVDALELRRRLDRALEAVERPQLDAHEVDRHAERILALYCGAFPSDEEGGTQHANAAAAMRDRLRAQLSRFFRNATRHLAGAGPSQRLAAYLARAREVDPGLDPALRGA